MFERPHHQRVWRILQSLNAELLAQAALRTQPVELVREVRAWRQSSSKP